MLHPIKSCHTSILRRLLHMCTSVGTDVPVDVNVDVDICLIEL